MTTSRNTVTKNQKIVIIPVDEILGMKSRKSGVNKMVNVSGGDRKLFAADNPTVKGCLKRGLTGVADGPEEKRQKMVPSATMTTSRNTVTKNRKIVMIPVDEILGMKSRKSGVNKLVNVSAGDRKLIAADNPTVKGCRKRGLTGLSYGPEEKRQKMVPSAMKQCSSVLEELMMTAPSGKCLEALMSAEEKEKMKKMLLEVSRGIVPKWLQSLLKEIGINCCNGGGNIELDMDAFGKDILSKLRRIAKLVGARTGKERDQEREAELIKQRERERKAARLALEQVEKTVEFDDNFQTMKDFYMLIQSPISHQFRQYEGVNLNEDREEGEIVEWR